MRKILTFFMCMAMSITAFAQIQIESSGQAKSMSEYNKEASAIMWEEDGYYFRVMDYECQKARINGEQYIIHIYLGKTIEEVQQSAQILQNWFSNADNEAFIYTSNPNGDKVCLYKYNANMYVSYGSEVECKATRIIFGADMTQALAGNYAASSAADKQRLIDNLAFGQHVLTGMCSFKKEFLKSIKNFKG